MLDLSKIEKYSDELFEFGPIQTKWLEALESGKYKQGAGNLVQIYSGPQLTDNVAPPEDKYCCLGVLCEVAGLKRAEDGQGYIGQHGHSSNGYIPSGDTFGLNDAAGQFKQMLCYVGETFSTLAGMNDQLSQDDSNFFSFADIAAYIRHDPHNVFQASA